MKYSIFSHLLECIDMRMGTDMKQSMQWLHSQTVAVLPENVTKLYCMSVFLHKKRPHTCMKHVIRINESNHSLRWYQESNMKYVISGKTTHCSISGVIMGKMRAGSRKNEYMHPRWKSLQVQNPCDRYQIKPNYSNQALICYAGWQLYMGRKGKRAYY